MECRNSWPFIGYYSLNCHDMGFYKKPRGSFDRHTKRSRNWRWVFSHKFQIIPMAFEPWIKASVTRFLFFPMKSVKGLVEALKVYSFGTSEQ